MVKFEDNIIKIKQTLRKYLLGENNEANRIAFKNLGFNDSNIKSYTTLSQKTLPSLDSFPKICETFGITLNELFGIDDASANTDKLPNEYKRLFDYLKNNDQAAEFVFNMCKIERD